MASKRWTIEDVEKLAGSGKVKLNEGFFPEKKKPKTSALPKSEFQKTPEGLSHIDMILYVKQIDFVKEYEFVPDRKFRADRYVPSLNLLIEYEGIYSEKSRHTFFKGYSTDADKYNLATVHGYRLLRFTSDNYKSFYDLLEKIIVMNAK